MDESTIAYLRRCLQEARFENDIEQKLNDILEVLDDLIYNLPVDDDE